MEKTESARMVMERGQNVINQRYGHTVEAEYQAGRQ